MRFSKNPVPRKVREENEQLRVQAKRAKAGSRALSNFSRRSFSTSTSSTANGAAAFLPLILVLAVVAAPFLYIKWVVHQISTYPSSRSSFIRTELQRWTWILSIAAAVYAATDLLLIKNHVYLSLIATPAFIWIARWVYKKSRMSEKSMKYETRKWESRRRRKLAKQQAREQKKTSSMAS